MDIFTVSFFGHRDFTNPIEVEQRLEEVISGLIRENEYVEFLVGRNGAYDYLVASIIKYCRRSIREDNSRLTLVLPYPTADYRLERDHLLAYYDEIEIYDESASLFYHTAFTARNRNMIDRSDLVVLCVQYEEGGRIRR